MAVIASFCVIMLFVGFYDFGSDLRALERTKAVSWGQSQGVEKAGAIYGGTTTLTKAECHGQSFAWAEGVGFTALAIAISVVAVGASVALSRIGRE